MLSAQPTETGQQIHRLTLYEGLLFPSGGDYAANTGPIALEHLDPGDPGSGFVSEGFTAQTEELWRGRVINGDLVFCYTDPTGFAGSIGAYARRHDGTWTTGGPSPDPIHVGDIAQTGAGTLALAGAPLVAPGTTQGTVWLSEDDGQTWTPSLQLASSGQSRCYGILALDDDLIMFGSPGEETWTVQRFHAGTWAEVDTVECSSGLVFTRAEGHPLAFALQHGLPEGQSLQGSVRVYGKADADAAVTQARADIPSGLFPRDLTVSPDGQTLYLLTGLTVWALGHSGAAVKVHTFAGAAEATAITVDAVNAYFGNSASTVYAVALADFQP